MSLHLLDGFDVERTRALLDELSLDQLMGLVFAKAATEGKRVNIHIRHAEARVRTKGAGRGRV